MKDNIHFLNERVFLINKKSKKSASIALLLLIMLASVGVGVAIFAGPDKSATDVQSVAPTEYHFPEIMGNGSDNFSEHTQKTASIQTVTGLVLRSTQKVQTVDFSNPDTNPCVFIISLYLGDGTCVFRTEPIKPGCSVSSVDLMCELQQGLYKDAILVYDCYSTDEAMRPLTRCEMIVEIKSI